MNTDMGYFKLVRRTDPTYTAVTAIHEWLYSNPDVAVELAQEVWPEIDPDSCPMDWDTMETYLKDLSPMDAFFVGRFSVDCDVNDTYFQMDGYGHFRSLNDYGYAKACVEFMSDNGYRAILNGDVEVPSDLAKVLALWGEEPAVRSWSIKCRFAGRGGPKSPVAVKSKSRKRSAKGRPRRSPA